MKKILAFLLVASLGLAIAGCGSKSPDGSSTAAPKTGIKDKTPSAGDE